MQKIRNFQGPVSEKMSKNPNFWQLIHLNPRIKIFFPISAVSLFLLCWHLTSWKVSEKTDERSLRYLTHTRTDGQGQLLRTPSGKPRVQNSRDIRVHHYCIQPMLKYINHVADTKDYFKHKSHEGSFMHISYSSKLIIYVAGIMQVSFTNVIVDCLKLCSDNIQNPTTCIF